MSKCAVQNCKNYWRKTKQESSVCYFRFPKDEFSREKWMQASGLSIINIQNPRICSIHFSEECFKEDWAQNAYNLPSLAKRKLLKVDAIPTLHLKVADNSQVSANVSENNESEVSGACTIETRSSSRNVVKFNSRRTARKDLQNKGLRNVHVTFDINFKRKKYSKPNLQLKIRLIKALYKNQIKKKQKKLEDMAARCRQAESEKMMWKNAWQKSEDEKKRMISKEDVVHKLSPLFTPGQIKLIMDPTLKAKWDEEDDAMSTRSYGHASYEYWRCIRKTVAFEKESLNVTGWAS